MDGRTGFAAGGFIVGATAVAVACAVTLSNSAALADVPGIAAGVDTVRVSPSATGVKPTPRAPAPAVTAPGISVPTRQTPSAPAEVVPAPEPRDVSGSTAGPVAAAPQAIPAAPSVPAPAQPQVLSLSKKEIEDEAIRTGSWDRLRTWATANGWSEQRIERWIAVLQDRAVAGRQSVQESYRTLTPAYAGTESGLYSSGSKRTQSPRPPRGD